MIDVDLRSGRSANVVLVDDVLVDTGSGSPASIARLRAFVACAAPVSWVALTHFHADHAGGAAALGLPVAAHEAEADTNEPALRRPVARVLDSGLSRLACAARR